MILVFIFAVLAVALTCQWRVSQASFTRATIVAVEKVRDNAGATTGIKLLVRMTDSAIAQPYVFEYTLTGPEFAALPTGATAKKAALVAILKREAQAQHAAWIARELAKPQNPLPGDPVTDLGVTEITTFTGAATPFPTPTP